MSTTSSIVSRPDDIIMKDRCHEGLISAEIRDIKWDQIYLHIKVKVIATNMFDRRYGLDFYLVNSFFRARAKFVVSQLPDGSFDLFLNFTNPGYNLCLPQSYYSIFVCQRDEILTELTVSEKLAPIINEKSGYFLHNKDRLYCFNFSLKDTDEGFYPLITTMDMLRSGIRDIDVNPRISNTKKTNRKKKFDKKKFALMKKGIKAFYSISNKFNHLSFKKKNTGILFLSEQSDELRGNLVCVSERMKERGLDTKYSLDYSARAIVSNHDDYGAKSWLNVIKKISSADIIFVDDHIPMFDWLEINKKTTKLIQLWHAGAGYKSSGYIRWGHQGAPAAFCCHRQYDYGICESLNVAPYHAEVFGINKENILPTGMPRMDSYIDSDNRLNKTQELYTEYDFLKGKKVILFAPTFRGINKKEAHYPYEIIDMEELYKVCGDEYIVLFKFHPWIADRIEIDEKYSDRLIDFTDYPNINDLFYITDLLITDYSSNVFEYSLMKRPCLFFAYDEQQYACTRGFHRDYSASTPGKICHTFPELLNAIRYKDFEFEKMSSYIKFHFDHIDSKSTDRVIDWFVLGNIPNELKETLKEIDDDNKKLKQLNFEILAPEEYFESFSSDR